MTISELKEKIAELQKELDNAIKNQTIWKPKHTEPYFFIDKYGDIVETAYLDFEVDNARIEIGNYYKTKEEAEFEANCEKYTRLYRKFVQEYETKQLDWENEKQNKYDATYDYKSNEIVIAFSTIYKFDDVYASSDEIIKNAIEFIGEDNFKKYVLRVEEAKK